MKKILILIIFAIFTSVCHADSNKILSYEEVYNHLKTHKRLPSNYIKKSDAKKKGWNPRKGNLWKVLPGKVIGGDRFGNREGKLPKNKCGKKTKWIEADYDYNGGTRGAKRLVFCFTNRNKEVYVYKTENHYRSFEEVN